MSVREKDLRRTIRNLNIAGFSLIAVMFGGVGVWASTSRLAGAVIAPGQIVVESNVKRVQHPTGGIVKDLLVREGDAVEAGQIVMRLDDTVTRATLGVVRSQIDQLIAREARLLAERDGTEAIAFPAELTGRGEDKAIAATLVGEQKIFESRRNGRMGQVSQLRERVAQSKEEISGLEAQRISKDRGIEFIGEELSGVSDLYAKNLVPITRLMALQREKARLEGERGQLVADIARAQGKISEIELQILQLDQDFRTEVLKDLRETQAKIAELRERFTAAEDQLKRVDIRAPQAGTVLQLAVHTVGGVVAPGETVMQIVPGEDVLVLEAKVPLNDIDQVWVGAPVVVRVSLGEQRTMPDMNGVVTRVAADRTYEAAPGAPAPVAGQLGIAHYLIRVSLTPDEIRRAGTRRLVPGMPADVFIQTHEGTPLEYLIKPLRDQIARTFRER